MSNHKISRRSADRKTDIDSKFDMVANQSRGASRPYGQIKPYQKLHTNNPSNRSSFKIERTNKQSPNIPTKSFLRNDSNSWILERESSHEEALQEKIRSLTFKNQELEEKNRELMKMLENSELKLTQLEVQTETTKETTQKLQDNRLSELENSNHSLLERLKHYEALIKEKDQLLVQEKETHRKEIEGIHSFYKTNHSNESQNCERLENYNDELKRRISDLMIKLHNLEKTRKQETTIFSNQLESLRSNQSKASNQTIITLEKQINQYKIDINQLQQVIETFESEIQPLRHKAIEYEVICK